MIVGKKAYDRLYDAQDGNILWGHKPGRLMAPLLRQVASGTVLDLGCGDGRHALSLEQRGFTVTGYDYSQAALQGLQNRFARSEQLVRGTYTLQDIEETIPAGEFDVLFSHGILQCLRPNTRVDLHRQIQGDCIGPGGYMVFNCLTNTIALPNARRACQELLVSTDEVDAILDGWDIVYREDGFIMKNRMPGIDDYKVASVWIIARKTT